MEMKNRVSETLNKKRLVVKSIQKDDTNEISELIVEEYRDDLEGLSEVGTPLTAEIFKDVLLKVIRDEIASIMSDSEAVEADKRLLNLNTTYSEDFELPSVGDFGSTYTWSINSGTGIVLNGNTAKVRKTDETQRVELLVEVERGNVSVTDVIVVNISSIDIEEVNRTLNMLIGDQGQGRTTFVQNITEDANVVINNNYSDYFTITSVINTQDMKVNFQISTNSNVESGEYEFSILLKSKTTGFTILRINVTIEILNSISPDD